MPVLEFTLAPRVEALGKPIIDMLPVANDYTSKPLSDAQVANIGAFVVRHPELNTTDHLESLIDLVGYYGVQLTTMFSQRLSMYSFKSVVLAYEYICEEPPISGGFTPSIRSSRASKDVGAVLKFIARLNEFDYEPQDFEDLHDKIEAVGGFTKVRSLANADADEVALVLYDDESDYGPEGFLINLPEEKDEPEND